MESDSINKLLFVFICIFILFNLTSTGVSYARVDYSKCEVISGSGYTTGVGEGYYTQYAFYNYCPLCHHTNCLERGLKRHDEITCYKCDADYSFSGKEKLYNPRGYLVPFYPEK